MAKSAYVLFDREIRLQVSDRAGSMAGPQARVKDADLTQTQRSRKRKQHFANKTTQHFPLPDELALKTRGPKVKYHSAKAVNARLANARFRARKKALVFSTEIESQPPESPADVASACLQRKRKANREKQQRSRARKRHQSPCEIPDELKIRKPGRKMIVS